MDDPNLQTPVTPGESAAAPVDADRGGPVPSPGRSGIEVIFLGPNGIRAGWRLLIYFIIAVVVGVVLSLTARLLGVRPTKGFSPSIAILGEGLPFCALLTAAAVMSRIERQGSALGSAAADGRLE